MAKAKDIRIDNMVTVNAVTDNQKRAFQEYKNGKNLFLIWCGLVLVKHSLHYISLCKKH